MSATTAYRVTVTSGGQSRPRETIYTRTADEAEAIRKLRAANLNAQTEVTEIEAETVRGGHVYVPCAGSGIPQGQGRWHAVPRTQGQHVEVQYFGYGDTAGAGPGMRWRRVVDHAANTVEYFEIVSEVQS